MWLVPVPVVRRSASLAAALGVAAETEIFAADARRRTRMELRLGGLSCAWYEASWRGRVNGIARAGARKLLPTCRVRRPSPLPARSICVHPRSSAVETSFLNPAAAAARRPVAANFAGALIAPPVSGTAAFPSREKSGSPPGPSIRSLSLVARTSSTRPCPLPQGRVSLFSVDTVRCTADRGSADRFRSLGEASAAGSRAS